MKKRTLIASTALLLVAIMCLATASYAWFIAGSDAKATGLSITTTTGTNLVIRGNSDPSGQYGNVGTHNVSATLAPATSSDATAFAKLKDDVVIPDAGNYAAADFTAASLEDATNTGNAGDPVYFVTGSYSLKNIGSDAVAVKVSNIEVTGVDAAIKPAIRVAIKAGSTTKIFKPFSSTPINQVGSKSGTAWTLVDPNYATVNGTDSVVIASLGAGDTNATAVDIVVWFEGQDSACTTTNANALANQNLGINVVFVEA